MFITRKQYETEVKESRETIDKYLKRIKELEEDLSIARSMRNVLEILAEKTGIPSPKAGTSLTCSSWGLGWGPAEASLSDNFAQYVDDYFGGKVIKQEATNITILDKEGKATYGVTRNKPETDKSYILIQQ